MGKREQDLGSKGRYGKMGYGVSASEQIKSASERAMLLIMQGDTPTAALILLLVKLRFLPQTICV